MNSTSPSIAAIRFAILAFTKRGRKRLYAFFLNHAPAFFNLDSA
jgi:hypothetical protein